MNIFKHFAVALAAAGLLAPALSKAQEAVPDGTYLFAEHDSCGLYMDIYYPENREPVRATCLSTMDFTRRYWKKATI